MRLRLTSFLAVLLGPAGFASAQTANSPVPGAGVETIDSSAPPCPSDCYPAPGPSPTRVWASAEYLLWWTKSTPLPVPLATTSNTADFGVLGAPSTKLLIGNQNLEFGTRNGGRFTLGGWLDNDQRFGLEGNFFFLGSSSVTRSASVDGFSPRVLSVPFIDQTPGGTFGDPTSVGHENAYVIGAPVGVVTQTGFAGIATLTIKNELLGTELNGVYNLIQRDGLRLDLLAGFRYLYLREQLEFDTSSPTVLPQIPGELFVTSDRFDGRNDFYGGQLGTRLTWDLGPVSLGFTGKVALGDVHQSLGINGSYTTNDVNTAIGTGPPHTGPTQTYPGGYFALPSNIGHYSRDRFGVIPEAGLNLNCQLTSKLTLSLGYTFLYVNSVVRPGEQIDRTINGGQSALYSAPAPPPGLQGGLDRPQALFRSTDFWAQGLNFGCEFRY